MPEPGICTTSASPCVRNNPGASGPCVRLEVISGDRRQGVAKARERRREQDRADRQHRQGEGSPSVRHHEPC
jgi:hypothetical protein